MSNPVLDNRLRETLISQPNVILDDSDIMRALVSGNEHVMGSNVVDMRGLAMERLEVRLDRLENTHRTVVAAAYDNVSGTHQVHRAVLSMLEPIDFEDFLHNLNAEVAQILGLDCIKLIIETTDVDQTSNFGHLDSVLRVVEPGTVNNYLTQSRSIQPRNVTLRKVETANEAIYGSQSLAIKSEACLSLNFGSDRSPGILIFGSREKTMFDPSQGTDLLEFLRAAFERTMRRWLS